jgi:uncharacterized RDD family membrane protein YckC
MHEKHINEETNTIKFNFDDFDIEEFELKPVNKGLGFHKSEERVRPMKPLPVSIEPLKKHMSSKQSMNPPKMLAKSEISIGALEADKPIFMKEAVKSHSIEETRSVLQRAKATDRALAFLVDLIIILVMMIGVGAVLMFALDQPMNVKSAQAMIVNIEILPFILGVFSLLYLLYFSVMDMQSSLGKELMGLTVKNISQANLAFMQSFLRTFISLLSFVALGLPLLLDFHSRLSESSVFKLERN